jgi:5S rRNA maturation endonuclease (ribonuclease M5)
MIKALYELLIYTSEVSIYKHYLNVDILSTSLQYFVPYRIDNNQSLKLYKPNNDELLWRDMTTGAGGDSLKLVSLIYKYKEKDNNLSILDVLNKIYLEIPNFRENLLNASIGSSGTKQVLVQRKKDYQQLQYISNTYKGKQIFTKTDLKYWEQGFIELPHLLKENVRSASVILLENKIIWNYHKHNPIFVYTYFINGSNYIKAYRPLETNKNFKWVCNFPNSSYIIEGLKTLPLTGDILIITKSKKDYMILKYVYKYNCIAPQSENTFIPIEIINDLKTRFKLVILLYDNDAPGIILANKIASEHQLIKCFIPLKIGKDVFEICCKIGIKEKVGLLLKKMFNRSMSTNVGKKSISTGTRQRKLLIDFK